MAAMTFLSDRDIPSTYRTKCMLFAFSRSFGDEVKLCSIFAVVTLSLFKLHFPQFTVQDSKITKEEETEYGRCSLATSQLHHTLNTAMTAAALVTYMCKHRGRLDITNLYVAVCMH